MTRSGPAIPLRPPPSSTIAWRVLRTTTTRPPTFTSTRKTSLNCQRPINKAKVKLTNLTKNVTISIR